MSFANRVMLRSLSCKLRIELTLSTWTAKGLYPGTRDLESQFVSGSS